MRHPRPAIALLVFAALLAGCGTTGPRIGGRRQVSKHLLDARKFRELQQDDSALAALSLAIEDNPKLTEAYMGMGDIYREREDYDQALTRYETAASLEPFNYTAQYNRGLMLQLTSQFKDSIKAYLKALSIAPDSFDANRDIASAYLQLGDPEASLPYALRATEINPDSQPAWGNLAATYSLMGHFENAIDAYRTTNELGELADEVLLGLADAHIRLGNFPRAINTLNSLIATSPSATAHERLGFALFKTRHYEDALAQFEQGLQYDTEDLASLNGAGACYITLYLEGERENVSHRDEALKHWRRSIQMGPHQNRIIDLLSRYSRV
ncbi:MAG: tetratricopeptide repeat protein [Algisphaera sp.]